MRRFPVFHSAYPIVPWYAAARALPSGENKTQERSTLAGSRLGSSAPLLRAQRLTFFPSLAARTSPSGEKVGLNPQSNLRISSPDARSRTRMVEGGRRRGESATNLPSGEQTRLCGGSFGRTAGRLYLPRPAAQSHP